MLKAPWETLVFVFAIIYLIVPKSFDTIIAETIDAIVKITDVY